MHTPALLSLALTDTFLALLRTVRKYMPKRLDSGRGHRATSQRWQTFVRNHAQAHDRDSIFSPQLDRSIGNLGLRGVKDPPQTPQAHALCERVIGILRRECLDFLIPLAEDHLHRILHAWARHYNIGHPYMSLGPGILQPLMSLLASLQADRHRIPEHQRAGAHPILGGLHYEYRLEEKTA